MKYALLIILVLSLAALPAMSQVPDVKLIVPGERIGKWSLKMTIADLARISGPLVQHIAPYRKGPLDADSACCPDLVEIHWEAGLIAATRLPPEQFKQLDYRNYDIEVKKFKTKTGYLYLDSFATGIGTEEFRTARGIGRGSSKAEVIRAYGAPTASTIAGRGPYGPRWFRLIFDQIGLAAFYNDSDGVLYLIVFRAGTAKRIWRF